MRTAVRFPARMTLEQILDGLARDDEFQQLVTRWERIPPRQAVYAPFPEWLDGRIAATVGMNDSNPSIQRGSSAFEDGGYVL